MASLLRNTLFGSVWIMPAGCFHLESLRCRRLQSCADMANPAISLGNSKKEWEFLLKNTNNKKAISNRHGLILPFILRRLFYRNARGPQHILNENSVSRGGIVDEDVRDRSDELTVLNDGAARRECDQVGTTKLNGNFIKFIVLG